MQNSRNLSGCQVFHEGGLPITWGSEPLTERIALEYGSGLPENERLPGDVFVYGSNGIVGRHSRALVSGPGILVGRKGTVGAVHYSDGPFWPIDTVYYVRQLKDDSWRFLYYLLEYLDLRKLNAATGVPGLSRRDALAIRGAFPPRGEQEAIASLLDAINSVIDRTRTAIEKARRLRRGLIQYLVVRGVDFRGLSRRSPVGTIPANWACVRLGDLIAEGPTNGLYRPDSDYHQDGMPIVRIDSFDDGFVHGLSSLYRVRLSEVEATRYRVSEGDILINRVNSLSHIGKSAIVPALPEATVFESNMMRFRLKPEMKPTFLILVLCSAVARRHWLARAKPAVNQASINQGDVRSLWVPLPDPDEQQRIVDVISQVDKNRQLLDRLLYLQGVFKRGLMQDLLTGRVRMAGAMGLGQQSKDRPEAPA